MFKSKTAFTLIEIMMVIAIVSLLVSVAIVEGVQFRKQANESNCMANLKAIASGFEVYSARHAGAYAPMQEENLQFLIDDNCLFQDLISMGQIGNFRYVISSVNPAGYDVRGLAVNPALADHNYQISTGGTLKRSGTPVSNDMDFKDF
ncbi:MAG: prepilin-type N-terminal cleavage/methylation domain-containing protein [Candidatus Omnitrophota bacterium]|nr:prepilin-type N-terminal cleavage/methylation domain-containing protein [Candidatus Omnitrophota bacterium]